MASNSAGTSFGTKEDSPKEHKKIITRFCCVPQCSNYGGKGIAFHSFPKENARREAWKIALKMGKEITNHDRVCQEHFLPTDYIPQSVPTQRRHLKKIAVPSQKIPVRSHDRVETSPVKRKKEARKKRAEARSSRAPSESRSESDSESDPPPDENSLPDETFPAEREREDDAEFQTTSSQNKVCQTERFTIITLLNDSGKLSTWTGISSESVIDKMAECTEIVAKDANYMLLPMRDRVVLCLIKLKTNLPFSALAVLFNISVRTCSNYFRDTVQLLAEVMKGLIYIPSKEETMNNMPKCFRKYANTRLVLDCMEIPVDKFRLLKERIMSYSQYKAGHTLKTCISVTPAGLVANVSKCFGGRTSDKKIVVKSDILEKLDYGDGVMVDKGFMIEKECLELGLVLIRPPFKSKKKRMSKADALRTADIARARVHVERVIKRLRDFDIISNKVSVHLLPYIDNILTVCAAIVNLSAPVLALDKF